MFNNKEYFEVNREERHFGNLLISTIIYDEKFRCYFFNLINSKINKPEYLKGSFDIYSETAILRDYWYDLGDYRKWSPELLNKRKEIICLCMQNFNIDPIIIEKYPIFWTNNQLWFPGKWTEKHNKNLQKLNSIQKENLIPNNYLCRIGWAFNAKPDLLIISNNNCIIIELKLESGIGKNDDGYDQIQTQQDIIELTKITVPFFNNKSFEKILLTKENDKVNLSWSEILYDLNNFSNELVKKHFNKII